MSGGVQPGDGCQSRAGRVVKQFRSAADSMQVVPAPGRISRLWQVPARHGDGQEGQRRSPLTLPPSARRQRCIRRRCTRSTGHRRGHSPDSWIGETGCTAMHYCCTNLESETRVAGRTGMENLPQRRRRICDAPNIARQCVGHGGSDICYKGKLNEIAEKQEVCLPRVCKVLCMSVATDDHTRRTPLTGYLTGRYFYATTLKPAFP